MVCHETFKDKSGRWVEPSKVIKERGKYFYRKNQVLEELIKGRSEKMSKSKKNVIDPDEIIKDFGSDTARLFMISDSPPARDLEWSMDGIKATYKYLKKNFEYLMKDFSFIIDIPDDIKKKLSDEDLQIYRMSQKTICDYTKDIIDYRFNTAVAKLREFTNTVQKKKLSPTLKNYCWSIFLRLISIITPHYCEEIAEISGFKGFISQLKWPEYDKNYLGEVGVKIVVMLNGKKKGIIETDIDINEERLIELVYTDEKILIEKNEKLKKIIFVKNKIINFVK